MKHNYLDQYSDLNSFIHSRSPVIKLISFVMFIVFIVLTDPSLFMSFALYGCLIVVLIFMSRIPITYILKKAISIVPFIFAIAIFIPFLKEGKALWEHDFGILRLAVTHEGLMMFWNVIIKACLSVLCMVLLMASTGFTKLLKASEDLKIPKLIVMIFSFMYRYIFVLQDQLERMKVAKDSRSVGGKRLPQIKALSNMLGVLFIKSYERGEAIYLAMCSRGFDGRIITFDQDRINKSDVFFLLILGILLTCIVIVNK